MNRWLLLSLPGLLFLSSGCGTIVSDRGPYSGVCLDSRVVAQGAPLGVGAWTCDITPASFWPLAVLDLPLSIVGDTLLLPLTLWLTLHPEDAEKQQPASAALEPMTPTPSVTSNPSGTNITPAH